MQKERFVGEAIKVTNTQRKEEKIRKRERERERERNEGDIKVPIQRRMTEIKRNIFKTLERKTNKEKDKRETNRVRSQKDRNREIRMSLKISARPP
jgi:hypothetical protein